jgi:hypothetical protein
MTGALSNSLKAGIITWPGLTCRQDPARVPPQEHLQYVTKAEMQVKTYSERKPEIKFSYRGFHVNDTNGCVDS